ncbi:MAG: transketolase family protein [Dehalococcoidia bacterium]|nr:transketolase family protein [Dehalococcoidia bacterium]
MPKQFVLGGATREAYGKTLARLGADNQQIVALDADLAKSTMSILFAQKYPDRFFDMGVAEQNMIGTAAGLALGGKIPFASTFAIFASGRCFDQLRMSVAQPGLNVKVVGSHGGCTVGEDGGSHHAIEDLGLMTSLPSFTVIVPADEVETAQVVEAAVNTFGPFYIRCGRPKAAIVYDDSYKFQIGKAVLMKTGGDVTVIANGSMLAPALDAADMLASNGIDCRVLAMPTVRPIDQEAIAKAAEETGAIVTAEEHLVHGGLGSIVAQVVVESCPVPMGFVGIQNIYTKSGKPEELLICYSLTAYDIVKTVQSVLKRKKS